MKGKRKHINGWGLIVLSFFIFYFSPSFAQDFTRLSERTLMGTARYVGMGGAMTAIGGDPSAVHDNPAGLGLYRRMEVLLTLDYMMDRTQQVNDAVRSKRNMLMAPQASWVFTLPSETMSDEGVQTNNFMISYHRLQSFARIIDAASEKNASLGALLASTGTDVGIPYTTTPLNKSDALLLEENGYSNEYALDWSMNISNKWYVGLGFRVQSFMLSSDADYIEDFDQMNEKREVCYNRDETSLLLSGVTCSLAAGLIYRPLSWLRLGLSVQTPSLGSATISGNGLISAWTDTIHRGPVSSHYEQTKDFHMPLHTSASMAFQVGYYGMLAFQYDYEHRFDYDAQDLHSLRAGFEVIPIPGMYINGGYVFESTFSKTYPVVPIDKSLVRKDAYFVRPRWSQYASVAFGYRGKYFIAQAAYQYRWQGINLYAHEAAMPYDIHTDTHRIVVTLGWHRY